jgi:hypothetical protein
MGVIVMTAIRDRFKMLTATAALAAATAGVAAPALASAHEAPKTATAPVAVAAATPNAPSDKDLHPVSVSADQQSMPVSDQQLSNARAIVKTAKDMGLPARAQIIAVATSMQESKLDNIGNLGAANDHDSEGLFQQRPSSGWGTSAQITNPGYATWAFLSSLQKVNGWDKMPLSDAAQKVQVSAYPDAYAKWENQAGDIVQGFYGHGPYANQATHLK